MNTPSAHGLPVRKSAAGGSAVPNSGRLLFGGDYNPEQWPREVWQEDVELMRRAGVTTATVGVFSWALLEPEEGRFNAGWLDDVFDLLHANGIGVLLATPTASPPPWFSAAHPDALPMGPDGVRRWHGSRDTYCLSAPAYRSAARRIARLLAQRYAGHPALVGWHVHNEYGTPCWCDHVAAAFRGWLQRRYGSLDALNAAWGTSFWSQRYSSWADVLPPRTTQYLHNPGHSIDFRRFTSDELLACFTEQREEIAAAGSLAPVTTNFMLPTWNHLEQWSWAEQEDFVSLDHYLDTTGPDGEVHVAYAGDLARSWAGGGPWLLMEQSTGITAEGRSTPKPADRILRNSLSYVARGSQGALFFQWRASTAGSETWHGALVPHAGSDSATFTAAEQLGMVLQRLADVADLPSDGRVVEADVAVLWHADGWWALENAGLPSPDLTYSNALRDTHRALHHLGLAVDFVAPGADLGSYRMVVVPSMHVMGDAAVATLNRYVRGQGGHLVVGCFTGVADETTRVVPGGYPGRLRDLLGIRVEEVRPLAPGEHLPLSDGSSAVLWSELVHLAGAEPVAEYTSGPLRGHPAVTRLRHPAGEACGNGEATYLSVRLNDPDLQSLLSRVAAAAGVRPVLKVQPPEGLEVIRRRGAQHDHLFVLNHGDQHLVAFGAGLDLITGKPVLGRVLEPGGCLVAQIPVDAATPLEGWRFERQNEGDCCAS